MLYCLGPAEVLHAVDLPLGVLGHADADFRQILVQDVVAVNLRAHPVAHEPFQANAFIDPADVLRHGRDFVAGLAQPIDGILAFQRMFQFFLPGHVLRMSASNLEQQRTGL